MPVFVKPLLVWQQHYLSVSVCKDFYPEKQETTSLKTSSTHPCHPSSGCHTRRYCHLLSSSKTTPHSGALRVRERGRPWTLLQTYLCSGRSQVTYFKLTHVCFVFGHGCHGVLVRCKLYICLPGYPTVWADLDVDPHWIQWWEELRNRNTRTD